jgi:23S rRNA (pseudouridine1915-N3)-methyltransferase
MSVRVLAVGKKHESWIRDGIGRYEIRLRRPFIVEWVFLPHSSRENVAAREEESARLLTHISKEEFVILLDERGSLLTSPDLAHQLQVPLESSRLVTILIGGAYGVDETVHHRADKVWSLSPLVFPHQLVRLLLIEQLYRAQEIVAGHPYHHS